MQYTTNYNLKMPESTDPVQISDLSENFSSIDALIKEATEGGVQTHYGTYTGSGTSGTNNRNSISFPFDPYLVVIARSGAYANQGAGSFAVIIRGLGAFITNAVDSGIVGINSVSFGANKITWYYVRTGSGTTTQLNESGVKYYYFAIG